MTAANDLAVRRALEAAGVEFIDENGEGAGIRLRKSVKKASEIVGRDDQSKREQRFEPGSYFV
jgi:hypothetical protein